MILLAALAIAGAAPAGDDLFRYRADEQTHWASPENRTARKGGGGIENQGAKGHAWDNILPGATYTLANVSGAGTIDRIWMTIDDRSPEMLRALKLDIYWDGAATPAVSVPLGDFFLHGAGEMVPMETALFASPEGRSFVSYVPMPFRKSARVELTNESGKKVNIFYDIDYHTVASQPADALYFHAWWHRERATALGHDFEILPHVSGHGRFLGASISVLTNPAYEQSWWGEGEVKVRLDGDGDHASLVGTGTEDYIGSAWGQGPYVNRFQGSPVATWDSGGRWSFYRFHIPDPIWFHKNIKVSIGQIGGAPRHDVLRFLKSGARLIPITVDTGDRKGGFYQLLSSGTPVTDPSLPDAWTNFYRSDDVAAVAYFYLDRPDRLLPSIAPVGERTAALRPPPEKK
ncbi:MAG: glycoside hydrolase family 172 protein [Bacillota bacterium]